MALIVKPYTFTSGTTAQSSQVNSDFDTLYNWANGGVDNANVSAAGFYASQLVPTSTGQATFGGAVGYKFSSGAAGQVQLTIAAPSGQSVDILDLTLNAVKEVWVDSAGVLHTLGIPVFAGANINGALTGGSTGVFSSTVTETGSIFTAAAVPGATNVYVANDNGATNGLAFNVPTGSTNGFSFAVNGVTKSAMSNAGALALGAASPSFFLDVQTPTNTDGIRIQGPQTTVLRMDSTNANAATRNWGVGLNYSAFGDFTIRQSTAKGGDPFTAGASILRLDPSGNMTMAFGGFTPGTKVDGTGAAGTASFFSGTGAPTFSAPNGSMYLRYDGGGGTRWYSNTSGASTSGTTWTAIAGS